MQIWGISDGRRGHEAKIEGLAHELGGKLRLIQVALPRPARWLAPYRPAIWQAARDAKIAPPYPDLVLACGRQSVPYARYIRSAAQGASFVVFLDNPRINPRHFDFVWAAAHDRLTSRNVMTTIISPHGQTPDVLAKAASEARARLLPDGFSGEVVSVLIGGPNSAFDFAPNHMAALAQKLAAIASPKRFLLITLSRRSPPVFAEMLRDALPQSRYFLWNNEGENPYQAILGLADYVIVTADSVNMVGEACVTGKPVYLYQLPGRAGKFGRFHQMMMSEGLIRPFDGRLDAFPAKSVNPTPEIAAAISRRINHERTGTR